MNEKPNISKGFLSLNIKYWNTMKNATEIVINTIDIILSKSKFWVCKKNFLKKIIVNTEPMGNKIGTT